MDNHEQAHAFASRRSEAPAQHTSTVPAPVWWRIRDLETAPRKLEGARLEGPSEGWPR